MDKKKMIMFGIIAVVATVVILSPIESAISQEEIYAIHAMAKPIEGSIVIPGDPDHIIKEIPVEYIITVKGSPSYNVISRHNLEVTLDMTAPNTIDELTLKKIRDFAIERWDFIMPQGYILFQPYV